ncbi:sentrin-specific protease 2-like [Adelges cooleyi]|uniref:sentrin-specific protease 2-like n=1 Tax=Adelges cooleyi TaxID=133065 RepID=UPI00217FA5E7|nr:sentrin-specific protease 2-like [Adelges cooleyi]
MVIRRMGDGLSKIVKSTVTPVEETTSSSVSSTSSALGSKLSGLAQKTTLDSKTPQAPLYSREISLPINTGTKRTSSSPNNLPPCKKFKLLTAHPVKIDEDWYGDQTINDYFKLIRNEHVNVATFDTFFFPALSCGGYEKVRRWTKKVDVFSKDLILIPVNENKHWRLVEVKPKEKILKLYDSFNKNDEKCLAVMMYYLQNESLDKRGTPLVEPWTIQLGVSPQQLNKYDCGVFVCESARRLAAGHTLSYYQHMAQTIRIRIKNEIEAGKLQ